VPAPTDGPIAPESAAGFRRLARDEWSGLAPGADGPEAATAALARYATMRAAQARSLRAAEAAFLGFEDHDAPFVVGVVGPVSVGKSTFATALRVHLADVGAEVVSTDNFLLPNAELSRRGILERKGFPESYDWDALTAFLLAVRSGVTGLTVPIYSHEAYDVLDDAVQEVGEPAVLVVEGLNLLQPPPEPGTLEPADLVDLAVFVTAAEAHLCTWFVERFMALRAEAGERPGSFFELFAAMDDDQARDAAVQVWETVNEPNNREHVLPSQVRADVVVVKALDHSVQEVHLRLP
jgi:type I pantothenate kinase